MEITNQVLFDKLCAVEILLKEKASKFSKGSMELVSAQEIADFIGYSYEHTKRSIISDPQFPNPVEFNGRTGGKTCNRWIAGEVVDFVVLKRKKKKADCCQPRYLRNTTA
ncbi:hypothetical protein CEP45_03940 [Mergibacter septicus]|uniref:hypothetical protein n=1 Tax=Mergibacter septicus TaxID=221402 RepID=UPI001C75C2A9|nr:hypothetical protein [Mergibacter septicus]QDJ13052.1 hypothetical protein CEP45_03940 [Mergibacter septicus]